MTTTWLTLDQVKNHFNTTIDPFLVNGTDVYAAADFVNTHLGPADQVIASPAVAWLLSGNRADFQMAVAAGGRAMPHLPANIPAARFAFEPDYRQARFVIIDNLWHNWAVYHVPTVAEMVQDVHGWPMRFAAGDIKVYENPD